MNRFIAYAIIGISLLSLGGFQTGIIWQLVCCIYSIYVAFFLIIKHHLPKDFLITVAILFIGPYVLHMLICSFIGNFVNNSKSFISLFVLIVVLIAIGWLIWNRRMHKNNSSPAKPSSGERKFLTPYIEDKLNQQSDEGDID